jgi:hypothetical protein
MIERYRFGELVVDGKRYTADVVITAKGVSGWWRQEGHRVAVADLEPFLSSSPEVVVVGTGDSGLMEVLPELRRYLENQGIGLIAETTDRAYQTYNQLSGRGSVIAALHLTC